MTVNVDEDLVRNLTNIEDTDLLSDTELGDLASSAKDHVENDADLNDADQSRKDEAGVLWTCRLVAMKMRGASAVKDDGDLKLEDPSHYKEEYQALKDEDIPSSDIMMRSGG